jgi:hypothetical protein
MQSLRLSSLVVLAAASAVLSAPAARAQSVITQWNFNNDGNGTVAAPDNSPAPNTGSGTAVSLGMTNSYTYTKSANSGTGSVTSDDILPTAGTANASFSESLWRIRGASGTGSTGNTSLINGWNLSAPEYSQGVEFDVSTLGFTNITVGYDWYSTTQGVRDLQEQYNLNISNTSGWININPLQVATSNDYFGGAGATTPTNSISFTAITGANDDPNFGIRLVSAHDPTYTGTGAPNYTAAALTNGSAALYNNNSGNWRFGNITFEGTPDVVSVPEPGTTALLAGAMALGAVVVYRRRPAKSNQPAPTRA